MSLPPLPPQEMAVKLSDPVDWVDRYGDALLRFASGRVASRELAKDLVQEPFPAAFRHRLQFDGKSAFGTWRVANRWTMLSNLRTAKLSRRLTTVVADRSFHAQHETPFYNGLLTQLYPFERYVDGGGDGG